MIWKWLLQNITKINYKAYLFFLMLTTAIWFLMKLSDSYDNRITVPLKYTDIKSDFIIVNKPAADINFPVSAEGFKMIEIQGKRNVPITVSLAGLKLRKGNDGLYYGSMATIKLKPLINSQFDFKVSGKDFNPDSLHFVFDKIDTVIVPVAFNAKLNILPGFRIYGTPKIIPEKVMVTGPLHLLDTLSFLQTKRVELNDLNAPFEKNLDLDCFSDLIETNVSSVNVKVDIVEFIEAETEVPVSVHTSIPGLKVKTFPPVLRIKYQIAMPDYKKISDSLFHAGITIDSITALRNPSLIPSIFDYPDFVENPRLITDKVDFIIIDK